MATTPTLARECTVRIWNDMVVLLGSAAVATVFRRALREACQAFPGLLCFQVVRRGAGYYHNFDDPSLWATIPDLEAALRYFLERLMDIFAHLAGKTAVDRIQQVMKAYQL